MRGHIKKLCGYRRAGRIALHLVASSFCDGAGASDEHLMANWALLQGGKTMFTMPRIVCLRSFIMSHTIHHRAQLGVYLRLNDIPVPAIYGPSADEQSF